MRGRQSTHGGPVDLQRGTTMFTSTVRSLCINSSPSHRYVASPAVHTVCTRVCLCPCILINTLLTPRPRHINHETMENAVGGGPTGVDLSIPLSCIPSPVPSMCATYAIQQWRISLSLSLSRLYARHLFSKSFHRRYLLGNFTREGKIVSRQEASGRGTGRR